jgi:Cdc6-like AAA superfamily ATPase
MLYAIVGDKGSGKTLTAVKFLLEQFDYVITDIKLKNFPHPKNIHQLRWSDIYKKALIEKNGKYYEKLAVNWEFFTNIKETKKNYCICVDEAHNVISSRRSMSQTSILFSQFISQIRKVLSDDPANAFIVITQSLRKIDIDTRELLDLALYCKSLFIKKKHYIVVEPYIFNPEMDDFMSLGYSIQYRAEKYYPYYDRLALNTLSEGEQ